MLGLIGRLGRPKWWLGGAVGLAAALGIVALWQTLAPSQASWAAIQRSIDQHRWKEAEPALRAWLKQHPADDRAWLRLGGVYLVYERWAEALDAFKHVSGSKAARERALNLTGELWIRRHHAAEAEQAFRAAAQVDLKSAEARRRLAYLLTLELRNDEARVVLWELYRITSDPRHVLTIAGLSLSEPDARDPSPELAEYLSETPTDPLLQRAQGLRLLRLGKPAEAIGPLQAAVDALEDDQAGRLALAECHILLGRVDRFDAVLGPEPKPDKDRARWWLLRGQAAELRKNAGEAITCWRKAAEIDPSNRSAQYHLGQALVRQGKTAEAKPHLERAEAIRLREVSLILAMDRYLRGGNSPELLEHLAELCRDAQLLPEARAWYEQVIRVDPTRLSAQKALAELANADRPPEPRPLRPRSEVPAPVVAGASAPTRASDTPVRFDEIADRAGLAFQYHACPSGNLFIADTMGGGVGLLDYDGDGWLDVYFVDGCPLPYDPAHPPAPNRLFRNKGDGTFEDVTQRAGVGGRGYGMGCAVADYDNDGHDDLFVTGLGATVLYRNKGDGTFEDVTERAGVRSDRWTTAAGFGDLDGDGDLDLVVITYVAADPRRADACQDSLGHPIHCPPGHFPPQPDYLFRNNGNGTFTDVSRQAGLEAASPGGLGALNGPGLGLAIADFDGDGRLDLFVANDATPNFLFRNLGGLRFEEVGVPAGVAYEGSGKATASMGVVADDLTEDGLIDLLHTNIVNESCTLLANLGSGQFTDMTMQAGLAAPSRSVTGFGALAFDADNDGHLELFMANGHVDDRPWESRRMAQLPQLFLGLGAGGFGLAQTSVAPYFSQPVVGRGAAAGDLDNDGRIDLVVVHRDAPVAVLRNTTKGGHWLGLRLVGTRSGRTPIGARVTCRAGGRTQTRWLTSGTSYLAQNDLRLWFGLGATDRIESLEVRWPSGLVQQWSTLPADHIVALEEGRTAWTVLPAARVPAAGR